MPHSPRHPSVLDGDPRDADVPGGAERGATLPGVVLGFVVGTALALALIVGFAWSGVTASWVPFVPLGLGIALGGVVLVAAAASRRAAQPEPAVTHRG